MTWCGIYSLVCRLRILIYLHTIYCLHTYKRIIKLIFNYLSRDTDVILYFNDPGIFTIVMFDLLYTFTRTRWLTIDSLLVSVQQLQFFLCFLQQTFEDTKEVIRSCWSMKDRQYNGQKKRPKLIYKPLHGKLKLSNTKLTRNWDELKFPHL